MTTKQIKAQRPELIHERHCRYCQQLIAEEAVVCHHCGHRQNWLLDNLGFANFISLLLFAISVVQLVQASRERIDAAHANSKAQLALEKVVDVQNAVVLAQQDVVGVAKSVVDISEILARSTGYGAGFSDSDRIKLKQYSDYLGKKIAEINKRTAR